MAEQRLFLAGIVATIVTALCCFTPVLVWLLPILGLPAWLAGADMVLLPLLAVFAAFTAVMAWRRRATRATRAAKEE